MVSQLRGMQVALVFFLDSASKPGKSIKKEGSTVFLKWLLQESVKPWDLLARFRVTELLVKVNLSANG